MPGEAIRIFTGAPIPAGADAVVMQEDCDRMGDDAITVRTRVSPGENVRRAGDDLSTGQKICTAGTALQATQLALLASQGVSHLQVHRQPEVAVIATEATVSSHAYQKALERRGIEGIEKACPLFVPLIEEGWVEHPVTEQVAHIYIDDIFKNGARGADVLVLACTHYPLIRPLLRRVAPSAVQIVDSAESTAAKVLECMEGAAKSHGSGSLRCYTTDSVEKFRALGGPFLGRPIEHIELIDIEK